jgi:hypothetical protein
MIRSSILVLCCLFSLSSFAQKEEKMKYRQISYTELLAYSINDTSNAIIDLFLNKKFNTGIGQMSFLPVNFLVYFVSPPIAMGLTLITIPLFLNGSLLLIKYRNKKLVMVLNDYKETGYLPNSIRRKAIKELQANELLKMEY